MLYSDTNTLTYSFWNSHENEVYAGGGGGGGSGSEGPPRLEANTEGRGGVPDQLGASERRGDDLQRSQQRADSPSQEPLQTFGALCLRLPDVCEEQSIDGGGEGQEQ